MAKKEPDYTANDIKTLSELEHIRMNPGMYIGETDKPNHLLYEVLDNALDEANANHAKLIGVFILAIQVILTVVAKPYPLIRVNL